MALNTELLNQYTPKSEAKPTGPVLPAGTYQTTLANVTQKEFPRSEKFKKPGQSDMQLKLIFNFAHETESGEIATISHFINYSLSEKGHLHKFLKTIAPTEWTDALRKKCYREPVFLDALIEDMLGREFIVSCTPSTNGKYNNLVSAMPLPGSAAKPKKKEPAQDLSKLDDDDIPF